MDRHYPRLGLPSSSLSTTPVCELQHPLVALPIVCLSLSPALFGITRCCCGSRVCDNSLCRPFIQSCSRLFIPNASWDTFRSLIPSGIPPTPPAPSPPRHSTSRSRSRRASRQAGPSSRPCRSRGHCGGLPCDPWLSISLPSLKLVPLPHPPCGYQRCSVLVHRSSSSPPLSTIVNKLILDHLQHKHGIQPWVLKKRLYLHTINKAITL